MITVTAARKDGRITEVEIKGHARYARHGKDIVCAAVSATAQAALMGLMKYSSEAVAYTVGEDGYMRFAVPKGADETEQAVLAAIAETMLIGLKDIESGYGAFVKLEER